MLKVVATLLFLLINVVTCGAFQSDALQSNSLHTDDRKLVDGLIQRHLFKLAESVCQRELKQQPMNSIGQAEWTVDLIKTRTGVATNSDLESRQKEWATVNDIVDRFKNFYPDHPFLVLVQVQAGLSAYARGQLTRQEIEAGIRPTSDRGLANQQLRDAIFLLEETDRLIQQLIPRAPDARTDSKLSKQQLTNLKTNLIFQMAVCDIDRASTVSSTERPGVLQRATSSLEQVNQLTNADQPLWWSVQIQMARAYRVAGNLNRANSILNSLTRNTIPQQISQQFQKEQLQIFLAAGSIPAVRQQTAAVDWSEIRDPEYDLLLLRAVLLLAGQTDLENSQKEKLKANALALSQRIQTRHGNYWGRRAKLYLTDEIGSGTTTRPSDTQILLQVAADAEREKDWKGAIEAYDKAAAAYKSASDQANFVRVAYRAALIAQDQKNHADAFRRFQVIRRDFPEADEAPRANLLSIWNYLQTLSGDASDLEQYKAALDDHLELYPTHSTAGQILIWRARYFLNRKQYVQAVRDLLQIEVENPHFEEAISLAAKYIDTVVTRSDKKVETVLELTGQLESKLGDEPGQLPDVWNNGTRTTALILAGLNLYYTNDNPIHVKKMLDIALQSSDNHDPDWESSAAILQLVAISIQQILTGNSLEQEDREQLLRYVEQITQPKVLTKLADGFERLSVRYQNDSAKKQLATIQLLVVQSLDKQLESLDKKQQLRWALVKTQALDINGDFDQAKTELEKLATQNPDNADVQLAYARTLSQSKQTGDLQKALGRWRVIANRSKKNSARWFEAKYHVALMLFKTGKKEDAKKLLEYMQAIPPGWNESDWRNQLDQLLLKSSQTP